MTYQLIYSSSSSEASDEFDINFVEWVPPMPVPQQILQMTFNDVMESFPWLGDAIQAHLLEANPGYLFRDHPDAARRPLVPRDPRYQPTFFPRDARQPPRRGRQRRGKPLAFTTMFRGVNFNGPASRQIRPSVSPMTRGNSEGGEQGGSESRGQKRNREEEEEDPSAPPRRRRHNGNDQSRRERTPAAPRQEPVAPRQEGGSQPTVSRTIRRTIKRWTFRY